MEASSFVLRELESPVRSARLLALQKAFFEGNSEEVLTALELRELLEEDEECRLLVKQAIQAVRRRLGKVVAESFASFDPAAFHQRYQAVTPADRLHLLEDLDTMQRSALAGRALDWFVHEREASVVAALLRIFGEFWPLERLDAAAGRLHDPSLGTRMAALGLLVKRAPHLIADDLAALVADDDPGLRALAIRGLFALDPAQALSHLSNMLLSPDPPQRRTGLNVCLALPFDQVKPLVLRFLAIETDLELLEQAGRYFKLNPDIDSPYHLWEIAEESVPAKAAVLRRVLQSTCEAISESNLLGEDRKFHEYYRQLQEWIYRKAASRFVQDCLARLDQADAAEAPELVGAIKKNMRSAPVRAAFEEALGWPLPDSLRNRLRNWLQETADLVPSTPEPVPASGQVSAAGGPPPVAPAAPVAPGAVPADRPEAAPRPDSARTATTGSSGSARAPATGTGPEPTGGEGTGHPTVPGTTAGATTPASCSTPGTTPPAADIAAGPPPPTAHPREATAPPATPREAAPAISPRAGHTVSPREVTPAVSPREADPAAVFPAPTPPAGPSPAAPGLPPAPSASPSIPGPSPAGAPEDGALPPSPEEILLTQAASWEKGDQDVARAALQKGLNDPAWSDRGKGALLRAALRLGIRDFTALCRGWLKHPCEALVAASIEYLAAFDPDRLFPLIGQFFRQPSQRVVTAAVKALRQADQAMAISYLVAMLKDRQAATQKMALGCMVYVDFPLVRDQLTAFLTEVRTRDLLEAALCLFLANPDPDNLPLLATVRKSLPADLAGAVAEVQGKTETMLARFGRLPTTPPTSPPAAAAAGQPARGAPTRAAPTPAPLPRTPGTTPKGPATLPPGAPPPAGTRRPTPTRTAPPTTTPPSRRAADRAAETAWWANPAVLAAGGGIGLLLVFALLTSSFHGGSEEPVAPPLPPGTTEIRPGNLPDAAPATYTTSARLFEEYRRLKKRGKSR
ncbi:MAG: hypothetical protein GX442_22375 [Candidatus Riflebacteria bacterium]|nr:hypothetical protein [Candidatus Riflebacteria bacterium]